jgi:N-glycosylase/DNA lyase
MEITLDNKTVPLNLEHTLCCGQLFRCNKLNDWWYGVVADHVIKMKQNNEILQVQFFPEENNPRFIEKYLRLDDDLPAIMNEVTKDEPTKHAARLFAGLRLVRQEPWECLISYLCATYKSIPAIKKMIENISRCHGKKLTADGYDFYTFPKPSTLSKVSCEELQGCGLGFRTNRVLETTKLVNSGKLNLEALKQADYADAKRELLKLPGVGQKVADCVLLFSLNKLEAFPIDVWMKRAATNLYADHFDSSFIKRVANKDSITPKEYRTIGDFGRTYFGKYAGYAQQYLFHMLRTQKIC